MSIREIKTSPFFEKCYKKLSEKIKTKAREREKIFRDNPFNPVLKTHKLHGEEGGAWAFWINYTYRIKFIFTDDKSVLFLDIGTHDIYK